MRKKNYLKKNTEEILDTKFGNHPLYQSLRSIAYQVNQMSEYFTLSAADLFYHSIFTIDTVQQMLAEKKRNELSRYANDLFFELLSHFTDRIECDKQDHQLAAMLVSCLARHLLFLTNRARYWTFYQNISNSTKKVNSELRLQIENIIEAVLYDNTTQQDELIQWLSTYEKEEDCLSDTLYDLIANQEFQSGKEGPDKQNEIIEQLKGFFYNDAQETERYIHDIFNKKDMDVVNVTIKYLQSNKMTLSRGKSALHKILKEHHLYQAGYTNFSSQLKKKGF